MALKNKYSALWKARKLFAHPAKLLAVFRDPRTPVVARILPVAAIAYVLFPIDVLPDIVPLLGQIDDIAFALSAISYALTLIPDEVFRDHGVDFVDRG